MGEINPIVEGESYRFFYIDETAYVRIFETDKAWHAYDQANQWATEGTTFVLYGIKDHWTRLIRDNGKTVIDSYIEVGRLKL